MTVTTTSLSAGVSRTIYDQSTKLSAILNNTQAATTAPVRQQTDATAVDVSEELLSQGAAPSLRVQSVSVAFNATKLDVIDSGATQVLRILGQLQSLASRATLSGISEGERLVLDGQFQALRLSINNVPPAPQGSEYTGASLVGGTSAELSPQDSSAVLGGFLDTKLLSADINIKTPEAAGKALESIATATTTISAQRETIGRLQDVVDFAAASVNGALQNQDALKASFDDTVETPSIASLLQQQSTQATAVQTARLPNNILQLLSQ